LAVFV